MTYSNKFNQFVGNVVGSKQFNPPISYIDKALQGVGPQQHNNFLYESAFGGGMNFGGLSGGALSPFAMPGYKNMYPHQQYNLKVGGGNQEQAAEYGPPHYNAGNSGSASGYGAPRFQGTKNKIKGTALSALTLLAFLYFLNLLQTCLRDQMNTMNPTVLVMTAGSREMLSKIDRVGTIDDDSEIKDSEIITTNDKFGIKTITLEENNKNAVHWKLLPEPETSITPKLQNLFLESQSWG